MKKLKLKAEIRSPELQAKILRQDNKIPAIIYGNKFENKSITVDYGEFRKIFKEVSQHIPFLITIGEQEFSVLIKDYDVDPVKNTFVHIDFYIINEKIKTITVVPINFQGESEALKLGSLLTVVMPKIKVKCFPQDIPAQIDADISLLKENGDKIKIADLEQPKNVEFLIRNDAMVAKAELSRGGKMAQSNSEAEEETKTETEEKDSE